MKKIPMLKAISLCTVPFMLMTFAVHAAIANPPPATTQGSGTWVPHLGPPPVELAGLFGKPKKNLEFVSSNRHFIGRSYCEMTEKLITIEWFEDNSKFSKSQSIATAYWPTEICIMQGGASACVAGKDRNGRTVIENWQFSAPTIVPQDMPGGGVHYVWTPASVTSIHTVYSDSVEGMDMVYTMTPALDAANAIFVFFWDSRDLYRMSFSPESDTIIARVASPSAGAPLTEPALNVDYMEHFFSKNHSVHGYVYIMNPPSTDEQPLVFFDLDRDGVLDASQKLLPGQWSSLGFSSSANYIN